MQTKLEHIKWTLDTRRNCTIQEQKQLLAVAEAAAALAKADKEYREFDEKARRAKDGVRYAVYNNMADERAMDMYRLSEALKAAIAPLMEAE